jgi:hypothetical protein
MSVRGITTDSVTLVQSKFMAPCLDIAREMGMQTASSLDDVFKQHPSVPALVVAESEVLFSPDVMEFFMAVAPAVERDPSLWSVSASNRNARPCHIGDDPMALHRTKVFPGPIWLLTRRVWEEQAGRRVWDGEQPPLEWSRGREVLFPNLPRVSNINGVYNQDPSLRWSESRQLADAAWLSNYDASLRARLVEPNVTHTSLVVEIPLQPDPSRQFVLWYESEQKDQATPLARHFGLWKDDIAQGSHNGVHDLVWHGARVLLVNTLEQPSLLRFKPVRLQALTAKLAAANAHTLSDRPCKVRQCRWTVLAGDSNMRGIANVWMKELGAERTNLARRAHHRGKYSNSQCEDRWGGDEWVLSDDTGCHIITQRFLRDQRAVVQLAANMNDRTYCGKTLSDPVRADERRPAQPNLVWFGHGLWDLPNMGISSHNLSCENRFTEVVAALRHWHASGIDIMWQTNYPIKEHKQIRNDYLDWEIQCQRKIAQENGLPIFDVAKLVEEVTRDGSLPTLAKDGHHLHLNLMNGGIVGEVDYAAHKRQTTRLTQADDIRLK